MIFKKTNIFVSDRTSAKFLKIFHLYKGFNRKNTKESYFIKSSALKVKPPKLEYKGFKRKYIKKGDICRGLIIKTVYTNNFCGYKLANKLNNSLIIIKKKNLNSSKYFLGICSKLMLRKKIKIIFNKTF